MNWLEQMPATVAASALPARSPTRAGIRGIEQMKLWPVATYAEVSWERMSNAVEKVRQRLLRAARALKQAEVPYAVAGGNAVAAWVSRVDEAAVRNTQDVDIVLRRADLPAARKALEQAGFVYRHTANIDMFLDGAGREGARRGSYCFRRRKSPARIMPRPCRMFWSPRKPKPSACFPSTRSCG